MASKTVGIDIGSTGVRVAVVSGLNADGLAVVDRIGVAALDRDAVAQGHIRDARKVSVALLQALKMARVRASGLGALPTIVGLNPPDVALAHHQLRAAVKPRERIRAIRTNGVQVSPTVPTATAALAAAQIGTTTTPDGKKMADLLVAGTHEDEVERLLYVCDLAGVSPRAVDLSAAGTMRALVRDTADSPDVTTVVDVGATQTVIASRQGLELRSVRTIPSGGSDITRALMGAVRDEDYADAERKKHAMRLPSHSGTMTAMATAGGYGADEIAPDDFNVAAATQDALEHALSTAAQQLIEEIAQTIEHDIAVFRSAPSRVALCGGTALLKGFKERLQRQINIEVFTGHPWAMLARNKDNARFMMGDHEDPRVMLATACAVGLALWRPQR